MNEELSENVFDYLIEESLNGPKPPDLTDRILAAWKAERQAATGESIGRLSSKESGSAVSNALTRIKAELVLPSDKAHTQSSGASLKRRSASPKKLSAEQSMVKPSRFAEQSHAVVPPHPTPAVNASPSDATANQRRSASSSFDSAITTPSPAQRRRQRTTIIGMLGVLAASLLVAAAGWSFLDSRGKNREALPGSTDLANDLDRDAESESSSKNELPPTSLQNVESLADTNRNRARDLKPQQLDLNDLPFDQMPESNDPRTNRRAVSSSDSPSVRALADAEIVEALNSQLADMWNTLGITPSPPLPSNALAAKIQKELHGMPSASAQDGQSDLSNLNALEYASGLAEQPTFAANWAKRVSQNWLRRSFVDRNGPQSQRLQSYLRRQIIDARPWSATVANLLGGSIRTTSPADMATKPTPTEAYYAAFAGGQNHRLVQHVGSTFLNQNLACSQCHDSDVATTNQPNAKQRAYWSMVAALKGIDARRHEQSGQRLAFDRQSNLRTEQFNALFELPNGTMQSVSGIAASDASWVTSEGESRENAFSSESGKMPRQAIASWIANSELLDEATVNNTWQSLFGRHLVPQVGGVDVVAVPQRAGIQQFLATQFRAHGRDLRKLVTWIAASDAFARSNVEISKTAWLTSAKEEIAAVQLAELVFASGSNLAHRGGGGLQSAVQIALKSDGRGDATSTLLAQPALTPPKNPAKESTARLQVPMAISQSFAFHSAPTTSESDYIARISTAESLSWEQRVAHMLLLESSEPVTSRSQELATRILEHHGGDETEALSTLLWAAKESAAN